MTENAGRKKDLSLCRPINFAVHYEGIDMKTNFNIYDLDTETGKFRVIREGSIDQT